MNPKKMTWQEISKKFDQEWVLLEDFEWLDEDIFPRSGTVKFHSKNRAKFDRMLERLEDGFNCARVFVGLPARRPAHASTRGCSWVLDDKKL